MKRITYHDEVGFIPGVQDRFNTQKSINIIHQIERLKKKSQIIVSMDAENTWCAIKKDVSLSKI